MRIHLIHGFRVSDGGSDTVGRLLPYFALRGYEVVDHDYGWVGLFRLRWRNQKATRWILPEIDPGDILIGHSNGCLVCWELIEAGAKPAAVICIQPALRRDTLWPPDLPVLCLHNDKDRIVTLGRMWGRVASVANPFKGSHGWGAAGRHGFTSGQPNVINWNTNLPPVPARGHSGVFRTEALHYWGQRIQDWIASHGKTALTA